MELLKQNYETSEDYERLYEIAKKQRVVCFIKNENVKDICQTSADPENPHQIGARGICYIYPMSIDGKTKKEDFIDQCMKNRLEFIDVKDE